MMSQDRSIQVVLPYSKYGCPQFKAAEGAKLVLELSISGALPGGMEGKPMRQVLILGNREGLKALGAAILAIAEAIDPDHHIHIDEEVFGHVYHCKDKLTLTIGLTSEPRR
jgi:hypothetical protein